MSQPSNQLSPKLISRRIRKGAAFFLQARLVRRDARSLREAPVVGLTPCSVRKQPCGLLSHRYRQLERLLSGYAQLYSHFAQPSIFRVDRDYKDRKSYRVVESRRAENGRCFLVPGPNERVSDGPGILQQSGDLTPNYFLMIGSISVRYPSVPA